MKALGSLAINTVGTFVMAVILLLPGMSLAQSPTVNYFSAHLAECELILLTMKMSAKLGNDISEDEKKIESCTDNYLSWAVGYAKEHPDLVAAVKEQHVALTALVGGLKPQPGERVIVYEGRVGKLQQDFDTAKRRVDMERKLAKL